MKKIYLLLTAALIAVSSFAQEEIAFIYGTQTYGVNDTLIVEAVNALEDFNVTYVLAEADLDLSAYDGMIIGESMGSSAIDEAVKEYTIPCVHLKAWGLRKSNITWAKDADGNDVFNVIEGFTGEAADVPEETLLEILEDHPIFTTVGEAGDEFSVADAYLPGYDGINLQAFDLESSGIDDIADNATNLALSVFADDASLDYTTLIAAIEANSTCENTVCFGIHANYQLTDAMMTVITNSLYWVMDMEIPGSEPVENVNSIAASNFNVYPNPMKETLYVKNASKISSVEVVDITGKAVVSQINNGVSTMQINTSNFNGGLYMVRINTVDGQVYTDKYIK